MLGSVKHKAGWLWYVSGKHPAAKDFLEIGPRDPLLQAFADWVGGGFRQWSTQNDPKTAQNSWRFWTRTARKHHIICGISRDSCDSIGRFFPLLIMGSGQLKDWEAHWELLPLVLDKTWLQMEYLSAKRLPDFNHLEDKVRMLPFPTNNWCDLTLAGRQTVTPNPSSDDSATEETPNMISDRSDPLMGIMPLINGSQNDPPRQLSLLLAKLKKSSKKPPNAVFMGGSPEKSCLVFFKRPLRPQDFNTLWSAYPEVSSSQPIA